MSIWRFLNPKCPACGRRRLESKNAVKINSGRLVNEDTVYVAEAYRCASCSTRHVRVHGRTGRRWVDPQQYAHLFETPPSSEPTTF